VHVTKMHLGAIVVMHVASGIARVWR